MTFKAVLFDLDGTLLNTAHDLIFAFNKVRRDMNMPPISAEDLRPIAGTGSKVLFTRFLNIDDKHPDYKKLRNAFFDYYEAHISDSTDFFPNMEIVLEYLEKNNIPWGIVTNKLTRHTMALLKALDIHHRPACIICGDTLSTAKPDPQPIIHACQLMQIAPKDCLYVGDTHHDVKASKAAGTFTLVALYGYGGDETPPESWEADAYIEDPIEILDWMKGKK